MKGLKVKNNNLKVAKVYVPKEYLAEKFGVQSNKFIIGDVENTNEGLELTVYFNSSVENEKLVDIKSGHQDIRRTHIDDFNDEKGLKLYDEDGKLVGQIKKDGYAWFNGVSVN